MARPARRQSSTTPAWWPGTTNDLGTSALPGAPDTWRATLLSAGTLCDLNDLVVAAGGVTLQDGGKVNDAGQVLAHGCDVTGENCRPYLLTPVDLH